MWDNDTHSPPLFDVALWPNTLEPVGRPRGGSSASAAMQATTAPALSVRAALLHSARAAHGAATPALACPRNLSGQSTPQPRHMGQLRRRLEQAGFHHQIFKPARVPSVAGSVRSVPGSSPAPKGEEAVAELLAESLRRSPLRKPPRLPTVLGALEYLPLLDLPLPPDWAPFPPAPQQLEVLHVEYVPVAPSAIAQIGHVATTLLSGRSSAKASSESAPTGDEALAIIQAEVAIQEDPASNAGSSHAALQNADSPAVQIAAAEASLALAGAAEAKHAAEASEQTVAAHALRDSFVSVSQRLSALLAPSSERPRLQSSPVRPKTVCALTSASLLQQHALTVLGNAEALTDAILDHVLAETVAVLEKPEKAPAQGITSEAVVQLEAEDVATGSVDVKRHKACLNGKGRAELDARDELKHFEGMLANIYCGPPRAGPNDNQQAHKPASGRCAPRVMDLSSLQPASLTLEQVRSLESYRTHFAQHCLAAREAGIDCIGPRKPGIPLTTATWLIWPRIADEIAMDAFEEAVKACNTAVEWYVDEMVRAEIRPV